MRPHEDPQCRCSPCIEFDARRDQPETDVESPFLDAAVEDFRRRLNAETWSRELGKQLGESLLEFTRKLDGDDGWRPRDSAPTRPICGPPPLYFPVRLNCV